MPTRSITFATFQPATISSVAFSTANNDGAKIVGDQAPDNSATFTFTPVTALLATGGQVTISTPVWYSDGEDPQYPFSEDTLCSSSSFTGVDQTTEVVSFSGAEFTFYRISYESLTGAGTAPVTLVCSAWRNPITPRVDSGYQIGVRDHDGKPIETSVQFSLDTTAYTA